MNKPDRKTIQDLYIRICKDSAFQMDYAQAAALTANVLGTGALAVCDAFGLDIMKQIANGTHPIVRPKELDVDY